MQESPAAQKRALRAELRARRRNRTQTERIRSTAGLTEQLIELVHRYEARSLSCYLSGVDEPNTRPFLNWARQQGLRVLMPSSRSDGLLDWVVGNGVDEEEGPHGMPEAVGELLGPIAINEVDLIVVPAAAVDIRGLRLGWGRGYYDKTLGSMSRRPPLFAVVFDDELVQSVPAEVHDQAVDGAVTPTGVHVFTEGRGHRTARR